MSTNIVFHAGAVDTTERAQLLKQKGITLWFTGLSASGKVSRMTNACSSDSDHRRDCQSTVACALEQNLLHLNKFTYRLDGDNVRFGLNKDLGFDDKSRNENIRRIGEVRCLDYGYRLSLLTASHPGF